MADFYAAKHLAGSDLGWFRALFQRFTNTKLKGINFNMNPMTEVFYRDLEAIAARSRDRVQVGVTMYGPAAARAYTGTFKLVKSKRSKNWRLNGTLVNDPIEEPGRFDRMLPEDIAIIAFDGRPAPTEVALVLLAQNAAEDRALWEFFRNRFPPRGKNTMPVISADDIAEALRQPSVPDDHPLRFLVFDPEEQAALEDVVQGGTKGARSLRRRRNRRPITPEELATAKEESERTGAQGEALVAVHFDRNGIRYEWVSSEDPLAPLDFYILAEDGPTKVDVKSTKWAFEKDFHLSLGQVEEAANSKDPYVIYRVFGVTDDGARCRISEDIRPLAQQLLAAHNGAMFSGITADAFSVPVAALSWSEPFDLHPDDDEDYLLESESDDVY